MWPQPPARLVWPSGGAAESDGAGAADKRDAPAVGRAGRQKQAGVVGNLGCRASCICSVQPRTSAMSLGRSRRRRGLCKRLRPGDALEICCGKRGGHGLIQRLERRVPCRWHCGCSGPICRARRSTIRLRRRSIRRGRQQRHRVAAAAVDAYEQHSVMFSSGRRFGGSNGVPGRCRPPAAASCLPAPLPGRRSTLGNQGGLQFAAALFEQPVGKFGGNPRERADDPVGSRARSFTLVARKSTMRFPNVLPLRTMAPVVSMFRTSLVAVPALSRVEPLSTSGPTATVMARSARRPLPNPDCN